MTPEGWVQWKSDFYQSRTEVELVPLMRTIRDMEQRNAGIDRAGLFGEIGFLLCRITELEDENAALKAAEVDDERVARGGV